MSIEELIERYGDDILRLCLCYLGESHSVKVLLDLPASQKETSPVRDAVLALPGRYREVEMIEEESKNSTQPFKKGTTP